MALVQISQELQHSVQNAMANPFRFERYERFAMQEVLKACESHSPAEKVFVDTAGAALGIAARATQVVQSVRTQRVSEGA